MEKITVGNFLNPLSTDEVFQSIEDAMDRAEDESAKDDNDPRAVWIGNELHRLFFRGYELQVAK